MGIKLLKGICFGAAIISAIAGFAGNWARDKQTSAEIAEEVAKAVANATKGES